MLATSTTLSVILMLALTLPLIAIEAVPAVAASAHNLQAGTHTKDPYDTRRTARLKQRRNRRGY